MKQPDFVCVDTNLHKLKFNQNFLGWVWPKMGVTSLVTEL